MILPSALDCCTDGALHCVILLMDGVGSTHDTEQAKERSLLLACFSHVYMPFVSCAAMFPMPVMMRCNSVTAWKSMLMKWLPDFTPHCQSM